VVEIWIRSGAANNWIGDAKPTALIQISVPTPTSNELSEYIA
jgi:hypothetical protein